MAAVVIQVPFQYIPDLRVSIRRVQPRRLGLGPYGFIWLWAFCVWGFGVLGFKSFGFHLGLGVRALGFRV